MSRFCLDTNVFIQAKNGPYGFDFHKGFWEFLDLQIQAGTIYSPMLVYDEIVNGKDKLADWVKDRKGSGLFVDPNTDVQASSTEIANYIVRNYLPYHAEIFLAGADLWVVAFGKNDGAIVVSHEIPKGKDERKGSVKIPEICKVFGVSYMNTYGMLPLLGASFVLST